MGALDAEAKQYLGKKEAFADAFNYLLYGGEQVIVPDQLREIDTSQLALPYGNNARLPMQKYRDLLRIWEAMTDGQMIYVILGAEIQGKVHYAMPVKDGLYDMIGYSKQIEETRRSLRRKNGDSNGGDAELYSEDGVLKIKLTSGEFLSGFRKTDKLIPIVTAVIYVASDPWDGPKSLFEMLDIQDKRILPFLNDYKLNIISAADMDEEEFKKFQTDLGFVMQVIKHQGEDADKVIEENGHRKIDPDAAMFLKTAANLDLEFEREEDGVDMCMALEKRSQRDKISGAIMAYKASGDSDSVIIDKILSLFKDAGVTKEYIMSLLAPKKP